MVIHTSKRVPKGTLYGIHSANLLFNNVQASPAPYGGFAAVTTALVVGALSAACAVVAIGALL